MTDYKETIIDLLRHGEPEGGSKFRGRLDDPLSELGWIQMRDCLGDSFPWQSIISSPLKRCQHFAQELVQKGNAKLDVIDDLREISFGEWEGLTSQQVMDKDSELLQAFWQDPMANTPPQGESLTLFSSRVEGAWQSLLECYSGEHLMLVCHGGTIRVILAQVLNMPLNALWKIEVPFANISRVRVSQFEDGTSTASLVFHQAKLGNL